MILEETGMGYIMQEDDEAMAKVSIIMPVYNEEQYLEQCLDSICGQTLFQILFFIINRHNN